MIPLTYPTEAAHTLFPDLDLGDVRRLRRFAHVVQAIAHQPGAALPELFPSRSDYNACLRLFDSPHCTHQNIFAAHQEAALLTMENHAGVILLIHDGTLLDFSGHTTLEAASLPTEVRRPAPRRGAGVSRSFPGVSPLATIRHRSVVKSHPSQCGAVFPVGPLCTPEA